MSVPSIPTHFDIDLLLSGIPSDFHLTVDSLPKITLDANVDVNLKPIDLRVEPLDIHLQPIEVRLTEFPSIRAHVPADFSVGLSVLGWELVCLRLCGEAQVITEPYRPNPCEDCGEPMSDVAEPFNK